VKPLALATIHIIKKLQLVLSLTSLSWQSTSMQRTQREHQISTQILRSKYAGNLAKIKNFKWHMGAWDMSDPFVILQLIDPYALIVDDCWAERKTAGIYLLKN
jgi:hypothetical protein